MEAAKAGGDWQTFPRDDAAAAISPTAGGARPPNPVTWKMMPRLAAPLALRRDAKSGLTAVLMSRPDDCFAISTPYGEEGHRSLYLSLFGRDLKAGQAASARARLVIGKNISDDRALGLYREYLGFGRLAASDHVAAATLLEQFKAADFSAFLGTTNAIFRKDNLGGVIFESRPGYVTGGTLEFRHRHIGIAIYESHEAAMAAVEWRRKDVAGVIEKGKREQNGVTHWWFGESQALLSIVHGRMVFEDCDSDKRYSAVEDELWATAMKFLKTAEPNGAANEASPRR